MVDTAEDNFRIEVRDREEKTHLETICRSPDAMVIQAAWHADFEGREIGRAIVGAHCQPIAVPSR